MEIMHVNPFYFMRQAILKIISKRDEYLNYNVAENLSYSKSYTVGNTPIILLEIK